MISHHPALRMLSIQCLVATLTAILGLIFGSLNVGLGLLVGGLVAAIPQGVFGWWAFRARGARQAHLITRNMFLGEGLKLVFTAALLGTVWALVRELSAGGVLAGFIVTLLAGQISLLCVMNRQATH